MPAAAPGGVECGDRIVLATEGVCISRDEANDALTLMDRRRDGHRVMTLTTDAILSAGRERRP